MAETVQSVERAFKVLLAFDENRATMSAAEIACATDLTRPTTYRLLATLEHIGLVRHTRSGFELTPLVLRLSSGYLGSHALARQSQPILDQLSEKVGEHVSVAVLDGDEVVTLAAANSPRSRYPAVSVQVGLRMPATLTSHGRLLRAFTEPGRATDPGIRQDEDRIRRQGYVVSDGLLVPDLRSIAAPVRDQGGNVIASVAAAAHADEVALDQIEDEFVPYLLDAAKWLTEVT